MTIRCLIVDDNFFFLQAAQTLLEREGLTVGTAVNGSECLGRVRELQPDVVLIDVDLGQENGFEVARRLSSGERSPPVIFISTHEEPEYNDLAARSGGVGFLPKSILSKHAIERLLGHDSSDAASPP